MQYNVDKDLVFVTKGCESVWGAPQEHIYELTHLQVLPPTMGISSKFSDVMVTITDMYSKDVLNVFKDHKHWN